MLSGLSNDPVGSETLKAKSKKLTADISAVLEDLPATETARGVIELATSAEVITGTDAERAVTPAGLSARTATDSRVGIVELATNAEAQAGTDTARAVTPAALAAVTGTEARAGLVEIASAAETQAWTDAFRVLTPAGLVTSLQGANRSHAASGFQKLPGGLVIQWGNINSTDDASQTFNFSTSFPSSCAVVILNRVDGNVETPLLPSSWNATGFSINRSDSLDGSIPAAYIAIGF